MTNQKTGTTEWYTPGWIIEFARRAMGGIDLDPASCAEANGVVGAEQFYTTEDNGLVQPWHGRVWLNPPYSRGLVGRWVDKLLEEYRAGHVTAAVMLTNNCTETQWCQPLLRTANAVCFLSRRVGYWRPGGKTGRRPTQGQLVTYLGGQPKAFARSFDHYGEVLRRL